jgi:hypothetical protein
MSGFLDKDTLASLEGKYVTFQDGVEREFRLVSHRSEQRKAKSGKDYTAHLLTVIDQKVGEEKEINADGRFMTKLSKLNHLLQDGSTIYVKAIKVGETPSGYEKFDYDIRLEPFALSGE